MPVKPTMYIELRDVSQALEIKVINSWIMLITFHFVLFLFNLQSYLLLLLFLYLWFILIFSKKKKLLGRHHGEEERLIVNQEASLE